MADSNIEYSIVVPFYNEEESVTILYESVKRAMDVLRAPYELIFINDGSTDGTYPLLKEIKERDDKVVLVHSEKKRGQTVSLEAGFGKVRGKVAVSLDGDMQNDPQDIPSLLEELKKGYDFVCGWRYNRKDPASKKITSKLANLIQGNVFKSHLHDISCTLRAYTREAVEALPLKRNGAHRFIPYLLMMKGGP